MATASVTRFAFRQARRGVSLFDSDRKSGAISYATVRDWMRLEQDGIKVRCRAVTTTLFARLYLADCLSTASAAKV